MQKENFLVGVQVHQFPNQLTGFIQDWLKQGGAVTDFQDRKSGAVEIPDRFSRSGIDRRGKDGGARIEIVQRHFRSAKIV